ncbi:MAG: DmsE family decaheme c-type cytochrome [Elusimicrobia bacterium]|nr:DmsE family decaheme c-type cytochrome [Elusimicrobiota bacterium]
MLIRRAHLVGIAAALLAVTTQSARAADEKTVPAAAQEAKAPPAAGEAAKTEFVGSETCMGCHAEYAEGFKKTAHGRKFPLIKNIPLDKACETCHGPGSAHAAAAGDRNDPGFATIKHASKLPPADSAQLCLSCHKDNEVNYWGVSAHKQAGLSCVECHSVHQAKERKNLKVGTTETCLKCHKEQKIGLNLPSHHPIREGKITCAGCHNPHGGASGNLRAATAEELCFKCHAEKAGPFTYEHPPVVEDCSICHTPHGSLTDKLLKQRMPSLCLNCHKWPHTETANGQPAFYRTNKFYERGHCTNCHREIHGSDRKKSFIP